MATNGNRRPPRSRIEPLTPTGSASEAAAIVAAVEQFIADTAPPPLARKAAASGWLGAALREGVSAKAAPGGAWGDPSV